MAPLPWGGKGHGNDNNAAIAANGHQAPMRRQG
jgi:hypothetical protein